MEKINFETFKNECKKWQGETVCVQIKNIIETAKIIENAEIIVNTNRILISNYKNDEINIDTNYISNFYKENKKLKCELDSFVDIYIYKKET